MQARLEEARREHDELTFTGGEPTLDEDLAAHIAAAKALGFRRIGLQTNGRLLARSGHVESLARAGLTDVHFSIHGAEAAVHDYHTGAPGSFAEALAALSSVRAEGLAVAVTTVVTRSNFRVLATLPRLLASRGVAAWLLAVPRVAGRARAVFDRVVPRLGLAMPFALHALAVAETLGLPAWIQGAPACLLGPFAARALYDEARAYGGACDACEAKPSCPGADADYLARFGGDELTPCKPIAPADAHASLRAMFLGVGEMAAHAKAASKGESGGVTTSSKRVALPMLGKVKPALAEVSAGSERKTGEALREIFPALFDAAPKKSGD